MLTSAAWEGTKAPPHAVITRSLLPPPPFPTLRSGGHLRRAYTFEEGEACSARQRTFAARSPRVLPLLRVAG